MSVSVCLVVCTIVFFPEEQSDKLCKTFRELGLDLPIDHHLPFVHVLSLAELEKCVSDCSCLKISSIFNQLIFIPLHFGFFHACSFWTIFKMLSYMKNYIGRSETTKIHGQYIMKHVMLKLMSAFK